MTIPQVSVLITGYNRERYIASAIESVLAQTFSDYEVIIVDDCSQDGTVDVLQPYLKDPRVRLMINKENLGQFQNRNHAASLAKGKYVKYVDSDDTIYPHCLEVMVKSMNRFPQAAVGISHKHKQGLINPTEFGPLRAYRESLLGNGLLSNAPTSTIYNRRIFERVGGFPVESILSDTFFLFKIVATYSVVLMKNDLIWYRVHDDQTPIHDEGYNKYMAEWVRFLPGLIYSQKCPLPRKEQDMAYANIVGNFVRYCLRLFLAGKLKKLTLTWRASGLTLHALKYGFIRPCRPYQSKKIKI